MDVFDLQAKISVDTAPYLAALRAAASETERLRRSMSQPITPFGGGSTPSTPGSGTGGGSTPSTPTLPTVTDQAQEAGKAIDDLNKKLGEGVSAACRVGAAAFGTFSAALVAGTKKAVDGFAQYEQLVGGVDTLFKESSQTVQKYAEQAYKTAGMSANTYMQTVTSFSASLLNSLDNDTEKAAEKANTAITDMADNSNKMGTSLESLTRAYMGFSRGNFMMLDNLALGFSGTKEGMQELLDKAEELSGIKYDISSYADIVDAIHIVQQEMGITGTTAKEAADTIEGSMNSTKAAIDNLMVGFARSDADIDKLVDDVSDNIGNLAKNAIPVAERAFVAMSKTAINAGKEIAEQLPSLIGRATEEIHQTIAEGFGDSADKIFAVETAIKAAAAGFIAFKAAAYVADIVDKIKAVNTAIKGTVTITEALKAANLANPYVLAATAIAAATAAVKSYIDTQTDLIEEAKDSFDLLSAKQKEVISGVREMTKSINESRANWDKTAGSLETNEILYKQLTDQLYKLDEQEKISNSDKEKMRTIVSQLNSEIDGLNIELDEQTGHLKTQKTTIDSLIASYEKQAKAAAYQERLTEVYKEQINVEKNLDKATREREAGYTKLSKLRLEYQSKERELIEYNQEVAKRGTWTIEEQQRLEELRGEVERVNGAVSEQEDRVAHLNETYAQAKRGSRELGEEISGLTTELVSMGESADVSDRMVADSIESVNNSLKASVQIASDTLKDVAGITLDFGKQQKWLAENTATSVGQVIDAYNEMYDAQYNAIQKSVDLYGGFEADTSTTYNDLWNNLNESAYYLNDWTTAIDQLQAKVDKGLMSQDFLDSLKDMGLDSWSIVYDMNHATGDQLKNYSDLWVQTNQGIKESTDKLMQGQKETTERQLNQITGIAGKKIEDYSKAFKKLGINVGEGLEKGIRESIKAAEKAVDDLSEDTVDEFADNLDINSPSRVTEQLGYFFDMGFADGIYKNTGPAVNAARYLAVQTYNAMVEELDIHSPSKKMHKLGSFTGEGFALGISDKEADVLNAAHGLAESAVDPLNNLTPIISKGGTNGAYSGAQSAETPTYVFNLVTPDGTMVGRWIAPYIDAEQGQMIAFSQRGYAT